MHFNFITLWFHKWHGVHVSKIKVSKIIESSNDFAEDLVYCYKNRYEYCGLRLPENVEIDQLNLNLYLFISSNI